MPATVAEMPTFEPFIQLLRGGLQRLRQAHNLAAYQMQLLVELVGAADYLTHRVENVTVTAWAEYLGEGRNTTAKSFKRLSEAGLIICADDLAGKRMRAGYAVTITDAAWLHLVRPKKNKAAREPVDNAPRDNSLAALIDATPRVIQRAARVNHRELPGETDPHITDKHISAKGGGISAESDPLRDQLEGVFPAVAPSTILATLETLRSEGITEKTLETAIEQALGAKASSLHAWFMPRARSLHERATDSQRNNQATRPAEKEPSPWCDVCYIENGETIHKDTCRHSRALQVVKDSQAALVAV